MENKYSKFIQNIEVPGYLLVLSIFSFDIYQNIYISAYFLFWAAFRLYMNFTGRI